MVARIAPDDTSGWPALDTTTFLLASWKRIEAALESYDVFVCRISSRYTRFW
jgi:hypothetical protein